MISQKDKKLADSIAEHIKTLPRYQRGEIKRAVREIIGCEFQDLGDWSALVGFDHGENK